MWHAKQLIFHGGVILLVGLLCGAPLGSAVVRRKSEEMIRAWRVAHSSLVMGGVLLLALGGVIPHLHLNALALASLVWAFIASSYVFAVVLPVAAYCGHRGLSSSPPLMNRVLYFGNVLGAAGMLVGTILLLWGSYAAF